MKRSDFLRLAVAAPWWLRHAVAGGGTGCQPDPRPAAIAWLLDKQSKDGAWRSDVYGAFRDGRALTPVVLRALAREESAGPACRRACEWLIDHHATLFDGYPVHLASAVMEASVSFRSLGSLVEQARERLLAHQCPRSGGWSYAAAAPPVAGPLPPMQQANLAATAMALDGLCAAGLSSHDPVLRRALAFVLTCQNHGSGEHDDGGFFQMADDPARNKAGIAGIDHQGLTRYKSYASATADGLRALRHCGESAGSPRMEAAGAWLRRFPDRTPADLKYYTARSIAKSGGEPPDLARDQQADGSWRNPAGEMRENCPVVATALALEALQQRDDARRATSAGPASPGTPCLDLPAGLPRS